MVFRLVETIVFDIFRSLNFAQKSSVTLFLAILALKNTWIHIGSSNSHDISANIEAPVDEHFGFTATLDIPYVYPYD